MTLLDSIILGIVEGLTEYLPVSSTGHLLLAQRLLGMGGSRDAMAANAYAICIQLGAILAVTSLYSERMRTMARGIAGSSADGRRLTINLLAAFVPAAVTALLFEDAIEKHLFGLWPVSIAWIAGGVVILLLSKLRSGSREAKTGVGLDEITLRQAVMIGFAQCAALWPGTSRSLATIVGAMLVGVSMTAAVEFSFLLGLVTLGTATLYSALKHGHLMLAAYGWVSLLVGLVAAYVSAVIAIKWMVSYITRRGLSGFGYYRLAIGCLVIAMLVLNAL